MDGSAKFIEDMLEEQEQKIKIAAEKEVIFVLSTLIAAGATYKEAVEKTIKHYFEKWGGDKNETVD